MNMLTTGGIHLQMYISIHQIGETSVKLNRFRPAILWELESRLLVFISDLDFPLVPEIRLGFDMMCQGEPVCRTSGKIVWKEESLTDAKQYGVLLDPDPNWEVNMAKQITRTVVGGRVRLQKYDPYTEFISDKGSGQFFDVFT
ncbi:hypothetical protein G8C92_04690 [Paenibacillus donghaensis]|uniref:hypothetical protein n=1 Tax=Paenibacillus donghaensis TaxID=414771 RepID=UPI0018842941|nr:hypothetical protein [Paenibacillus donghaensis]MBE9913340.1 hypothetical protein [Paenibacillus donghaensis]